MSQSDSSFYPVPGDSAPFLWWPVPAAATPSILDRPFSSRGRWPPYTGTMNEGDYEQLILVVHLQYRYGAYSFAAICAPDRVYFNVAKLTERCRFYRGR